jgi:hypothetical protein
MYEKKFILLIVPAVALVFCFSNCKKSSSSSDVNLTSGLIAYYPFNGNANDASGNKLNGTVVGGVTFTNDASGKANSAATFDGSTGYIIVPDSPGTLQPNAISISFLVTLTNPSVRNAFISNLNFSDASGYSYAVQIGQYLDQAEFGVETNTNGCAVAPNDPSSAITMANTIAPNKWYNIVAIFSDSLQQIFVNGILNTAITRNFGTLNHCSKSNLIIGGWWSGDLLPIGGTMDEVRIYNRALNQDEINQLAKAVQ